jgi:hypothetical protein
MASSNGARRENTGGVCVESITHHFRKDFEVCYRKIGGRCCPCSPLCTCMSLLGAILVAFALAALLLGLLIKSPSTTSLISSTSTMKSSGKVSDRLETVEVILVVALDHHLFIPSLLHECINEWRRRNRSL